MGLKVNLDEAQGVLDEAACWASSDRPVPKDWVSWTKQIDASPSKTFTVALGTALLAKATNPDIDALALKATSGESAYSARTVGHKVLVPGAITYGYDLRATGREPLNNQPFFRYDRIDEIDRIHVSAKPFLPHLIQACNALNRLEKADALAALAAFLRVRMKAVTADTSFVIGSEAFSMRRLIEEAEGFIQDKPEHGRRGQAFVAAVFDLVSPNVRTARINDPSRRLPGDVQIFHEGALSLAVEVRQKLVSHTEALQFAETLRKANLNLGLVAMLDPTQPKLDGYDLLIDAENLHGVALAAAYGAQDLLLGAATWSEKSLGASLDVFPHRMLARLRELEASRAAIAQWQRLFS